MQQRLRGAKNSAWISLTGPDDRPETLRLRMALMLSSAAGRKTDPYQLADTSLLQRKNDDAPQGTGRQLFFTDFL